MKRILAYTLVAVLLGVGSMLAPFALFVSEMDTQAERFHPFPAEYTQAMSSKTEQTRGIPSATLSSEIPFIAFMLTISLVIALGVMRHFKRKTVF